jgi:hypothetical protein
MLTPREQQDEFRATLKSLWPYGIVLAIIAGVSIALAVVYR